MTNLQKGILLTITSAIMLATMGLFFKLINTDINSYEKLLARGLGLVIVATILVKQARAKARQRALADASLKPDQVEAAVAAISYFGHKKNQPLLLMRSLFGGAAMLVMIYTLNTLSLADSDMLVKLNMVFLIILSALFLKEKATWVHYLVVAICIPGLALIIKPGFDNPHTHVYYIGLGGTLMVSIAYLCIRYLTTKQQGEHPATIMLHLSLVIIATMAVPAYLHHDGFSGKGLQYFYLFLASLCSAFGQIALTFSFKFAPAKEVSVYNYCSLIFNALIGFIIFGTIPDIFSVLGYSIIVGCGVFLYFYNRNLTKRLPTPTSAQ